MAKVIFFLHCATGKGRRRADQLSPRSFNEQHKQRGHVDAGQDVTRHDKGAGG